MAKISIFLTLLFFISPMAKAITFINTTIRTPVSFIVTLKGKERQLVGMKENTKELDAILVEPETRKTISLLEFEKAFKQKNTTNNYFTIKVKYDSAYVPCKFTESSKNIDINKVIFSIDEKENKKAAKYKCVVETKKVKNL